MNESNETSQKIWKFEIPKANDTGFQFGTDDTYDSTKFEDYIFNNIYGGIPAIRTSKRMSLAETEALNYIVLFFGIFFTIADLPFYTTMIKVAFPGSLIFYFSAFLFLIIGTALLYLGTKKFLQIRFYKKLIKYFSGKREIIAQVKEFELKIREDIADSGILSIQVTEISMLISRIPIMFQELESSLNILKGRSKDFNFNKDTYSTIQVFLEREIHGLTKFSRYILQLIHIWNEGHKNELSTIYLQIQKQIQELRDKRPELAESLILTNNRLQSHIEASEKVTIRI